MSLLCLSSLSAGAVSEGDRESSAVRQGVLPADGAVSCSPGGRADVQRSYAPRRAGAGDAPGRPWEHLFFLSLFSFWFKFRFFCAISQFRVAALNHELQALRSQLEDADSLHERDVQSGREACADLQSHAEVALKEVRMPFKGGEDTKKKKHISAFMKE